jgi:phenylalanine-4-hydroxylase
MMEFKSAYKAHVPDSKGFVTYSDEENRVWRVLFERQMDLLPGCACEEFLTGLKILDLNALAIPQIPELNQKLQEKTGWQVEPVAALIPARDFFELLAHKKFPAATFIRTEEEINYLKEPDIFHEIFGHCPMLTDSVYANFVSDYARIVLTFPESDWPLLQRLFWFTVEFGLVQTPQGTRAYGGGILSSISETVYSVKSDIPLRALFEPVAVFRTPYRIDMLQTVYFVAENYQVLYDFLTANIKDLMNRARELGEFPPFFPIERNNPNVHISAC